MSRVGGNPELQAQALQPMANLIRPDDVVIPLWQGDKYNQDDIYRAAISYSSVGSIAGAAKITGYPAETIHAWRNDQRDVWDMCLILVRSQQDQNLDTIYSRIILKALIAIEDRIDNGDDKLVKEDGIHVLKKCPITGKDLSVIAAINFDKRQLVRNLPTSIGVSAEIKLTSLADKLKIIGESSTSGPIDAVKMVQDMGYGSSED
jgi:hypothetical protein